MFSNGFVIIRCLHLLPGAENFRRRRECAAPDTTFFFHHIDAELKRRSLAELKRVIKPGGTLVIVDVDVPSTGFGKLCAWSGYWLFKQEEIRENIEGDLRRALADTAFREVTRVAHRSGYVTVFKVVC